MGSAPSKKPDLQDVAMDLKMTARTMEKQACKLEQSEKANKKKIMDVSTTFSILTLLRLWQKTKWRQLKSTLKLSSGTKKKLFPSEDSVSKWAPYLPSLNPRTALRKYLKAFLVQCLCCKVQ